jgi:hypothetical protein
MRHYYRLIILSSLLIANKASAWQLFVEGLEWRATESNNWSYVNSETLPHQTIDYNTIDFHYSPGIRVGVTYTSTWDATFSYTHYYTTTNGSTSGLIRPSFIGSVTAQPSAADLYHTAQFSQSINYNIFDLNVGKQFKPAEAWMLHPIAGLMGGWIYQNIHAAYQQPAVSTNEKITNNFVGVGPKAGVDTSIDLYHYHDCQPKLMASFAASYLVGNWVIRDVTDIIPTRQITVTGPSQSMGALALQGSIAFGIDYKKLQVKLAYEIGDWFNQVQFFDNDTGTHDNDLVLQGLTLGLTYNLDN